MNGTDSRSPGPFKLAGSTRPRRNNDAALVFVDHAYRLHDDEEHDERRETEREQERLHGRSFLSLLRTNVAGALHAKAHRAAEHLDDFDGVALGDRAVRYALPARAVREYAAGEVAAVLRRTSIWRRRALPTSALSSAREGRAQSAPGEAREQEQPRGTPVATSGVKISTSTRGQRRNSPPGSTRNIAPSTSETTPPAASKPCDGTFISSPMAASPTTSEHEPAELDRQHRHAEQTDEQADGARDAAEPDPRRRELVEEPEHADRQEQRGEGRVRDRVQQPIECATSASRCA